MRKIYLLMLAVSFLMATSFAENLGEGRLPHGPRSTDSVVKLTTSQKKGSKISLKLDFDGEIKVEGASGSIQQNKNCSLTIESSEIVFTGDLKMLSAPFQKITSVEFVNADNLSTLNLMYNDISDIDFSQAPNLVNLDLSLNDFKKIDFSPLKKLKALSFRNNRTKLDKLDFSGCKSIKSLDVSADGLQSLNLSGLTMLKQLSCNQNKLSEIDLTDCQSLVSLEIFLNQLFKLDLSKNIALQKLICHSNPLMSLNLEKQTELVLLDCGLNKALVNLNLKNQVNLSILDCGGCSLSELDLSNNPKLTRLNCYRNSITNIDLSNQPSLRKVSCYSNRLSAQAIQDMLNSIHSIKGLEPSADPSEGELIIINTKDDQEKNVCTVSSVGIATEKGWRVIDYNGKYKDKVPYAGSADPVDPTNDKYITFKTSADINSNFKMTVRAEGPVKIEGLEGEWADGAEVTYKVVKQDVKLIGNIYFLDLSMNPLEDIDVSNAPLLTALNIGLCSHVKKLDLSKNKELNDLKCEYNELTELNLGTNSNLRKVLCYSNKLTNLDLTGCPNLQRLNCMSNKLSAIDLSKNKDLIGLSVSGNPLGSIDLSIFPKLKTLWADKCDLTSVDLGVLPEIDQVLISYNDLKNIDLSKTPKLKVLMCINTGIHSLDLSKTPNLLLLNCSLNAISLDEMAKIVNSLPDFSTQPGEGYKAEFYPIDTDNQIKEENQISGPLIKIANQKSWKVIDWHGSVPVELTPGYTDNELIDSKMTLSYIYSGHYIEATGYPVGEDAIIYSIDGKILWKGKVTGNSLVIPIPESYHGVVVMSIGFIKTKCLVP